MRSSRSAILFVVGLGVLALSSAPVVSTPEPTLSTAAVTTPVLRPAVPLSADERAVVSFFESRSSGLLKEEIRQVARALCDESKRVGLDSALVLAVIDVESSGYNFSVSPVGALGLMQLLPTTGAAVAGELGIAWRGPATLVDPESNVRLGVHYLAHLIKRFGRVEDALAAYNWGPTRIAARIGRGETVPVVYTRRVLDSFAGQELDM